MLRSEKRMLRRFTAAATAVLLAIALFPCFAFADTRTPDEMLPIPASESEAPADEDAPWLYYDMTEEEYYEEFEPWRAEGLTEDEYWEKYWAEYDENYEKELREYEREMRENALLEFGFTDTEALNVIINGKPLHFAGAKPLVRDGATMVPARAVLEALGAELRYDGKAKTVTAVADGTTVAFTAGERTVLVTKDGRTEKIETAAAPFIDAMTASAYVPLRALAESFGFEVYWDGYYKLADVVDKTAIVKEVDADFTVLNALMQSELSGKASEKSEKTVVNFTADLDARYNPDYYYTEDASGEIKGDASLKGAITLLTGSGAFDVTGNVSLTANGFEDLLGEIEQDAELRGMLEELKKGTSFDAIVNYEEFVAYLRLPILSYVEPLLDKKAWIEFQAEDDALIADFQAAVAEAKTLLANGEASTIGNLLYRNFAEYDYPRYGSASDFNRIERVRDFARFLEPFFGDAYMETSGNVHTISLNRLEIFNVLEKFAEEDEISFFTPSDYAEFLSSVPVANYTLRITDKSGAADSIELSLNAKIKQDYGYDEDDEYVEFHYDVAGDAQKARVDYSIIADMGPEVAGTFKLHADVVVSPTDKTPRTAPPAGSKIVSPDDL
ncbi:MAG: copper amine oxidase N-terminal domain-containing protein [Clostridiales Family XIII bacterium]|nr:copper amine oxidase N-terminal domain-containing protein [Clostridiales Family XIII bacterium]